MRWKEEEEVKEEGMEWRKEGRKESEGTGKEGKEGRKGRKERRGRKEGRKG